MRSRWILVTLALAIAAACNNRPVVPLDEADDGDAGPGSDVAVILDASAE